MVELQKFLEDYGEAKISGEERRKYGSSLSRLLDSQGRDKTFLLLSGFMNKPELSFYLAGLLYHLKDTRFLGFLKTYKTACNDSVSQQEIDIAIKSMEPREYTS